MLWKTIIAVYLCLAARLVMAQDQPNILFIMSDDLGYADLSCYGSSDIRTPNLDRLAAEGIRFTQAYAAAPVCTPSRTACMTGLYPARTEVGLMEPLDWTSADSMIGLSASLSSIPALLRKAGYHTALIGKWHLGFQPAFSPRANGFDYFFGYNGGGIDYISHTDPSGQPDLYENESAVTRQGYLTDVLAGEAVRYLSMRSGKPFFLSLQFNAPHWPWQTRESAAYPANDSMWKKGGSRAIYVRMVEEMDEAIGRVLQALRQYGLENNTLVVFTSDNGGERFSDNGGLRERKMTLWEGGIRVPALFRWPGKIGQGRVSGQPIIHMDWAATFLSIAGVAQSAPSFEGNARETQVGGAKAVVPASDGISLWPMPDESGTVRSRQFYWRVTQRRQQSAMRDGPWKYLRTEDGTYLFNLERDPKEEVDLKEKEPGVFERMKRQYQNWDKAMLPALPLR